MKVFCGYLAKLDAPHSLKTMSDYDDSFDDSFDSASDSDHGTRDEEYAQNIVTNLSAADTNKYQTLFGGGTGVEFPPVRKDMLGAGYGGGEGSSIRCQIMTIGGNELAS